MQRDGVDAGTVRWEIHVPGTGHYTLSRDATSWELSTTDGAEPTADVTITAGRSALARYLTDPRRRTPTPDDVEITGKAAAIRTFVRAIDVFPPRAL